MMKSMSNIMFETKCKLLWLEWRYNRQMDMRLYCYILNTVHTDGCHNCYISDAQCAEVDMIEWKERMVVPANTNQWLKKGGMNEWHSSPEI